MLAYRDFVPMVTPSTLWRAETYESFDAAVAAANDWLAREGPTVLHVETVVLPNVHSAQEAGTSDASLGTAAGWASWHQFLRVWYSVS